MVGGAEKRAEMKFSAQKKKKKKSVICANAFSRRTQFMKGSERIPMRGGRTVGLCCHNSLLTPSPGTHKGSHSGHIPATRFGHPHQQRKGSNPGRSDVTVRFTRSEVRKKQRQIRRLKRFQEGNTKSPVTN